ncbi:thermonuclease family protein [Desulfatibacillum aliphaticivorans]|uniref:thermonuclease family protein n=1 Tax=Desulfatibacillum aliphaticivorans TaxID=218208 RepID=UPI00040F25CB|nr:thermonuclease family protein [Desulfatibacillum aliphaticivorans]
MKAFSAPIRIKRILALSAVALCLWSLTAFGGREFVRVERVLDGDTIILADGRHVRYIGINAPEIAHDHYPAEPLGDQALACNRALVQGEKVRLETDLDRKDRYNRLLAYVYLKDGVFVNREIISQGMAYCLYRSPNEKHFAALLMAQRKAMQTQKGLWAGLHPINQPYLGNSRSRRFHLPQCKSAAKTNPKNRRDFDSMWSAFYEGYAPCKRCLGDWQSRK